VTQDLKIYRDDPRTGRCALALVLVVGCGDHPAVARRDAPAHAPALMPHPAPQQRRGDPVAQNAECEGCHPEVAAEWRASLHREAYTSREFQHALRAEPLDFCRSCHAAEVSRPAPQGDQERIAAAEALGVACVTCHLPAGDAVLAAPRERPDAAPHPIRRDPAFASPAACAACHEFEFPDRRPVPEFMQTTVTEHARSPAADRSCADCHMPALPGGRRSHAFLASRDRAWMASVVTITAARPAADRVEITLDLDRSAVGHALPTGDLFRQIAVEALSTRRVLRPPTARATLARHWHMRGEGGQLGRTLDRDDRLGVDEGPRVITLQLDPADHNLPIRWRVRYERVESFVGVKGEAVIVGGVNLGDGTLAPP
jgi:nitrate/TMAO reductase-like tetraheme cytochrome c subunit